MRQHKAFRLAEFKAAADGEVAGTFEALVSVFGNVDLEGERVVSGAFTKSLDKWRASGDPIPVVWNHAWDNPDAHIGYVDPADAMETPDGLLVSGVLDVGKPFAGQVYDLLKARRVREFSFSYDVTQSQSKAANGATELTELDLIELGPTLKGMNPATELLAVKAGARNASADLKMLQQLHDTAVALGALCADPAAADEPPAADTGKAVTPGTGSGALTARSPLLATLDLLALEV